MLTEKDKHFIETQRKKGKYLLMGILLFFVIGIFLHSKFLDIGFNISEQNRQINIPPDIKEFLIAELTRQNIKGFISGIFPGILLGIYLWNKKWLRIMDKFNSLN